ncbi:MAG: hypothetical protein ACK5MV_10490 [Aminipila sp.]
MKKRYMTLNENYYAIYYIRTNTIIYNNSFKGGGRVIHLID